MNEWIMSKLSLKNELVGRENKDKQKNGRDFYVKKTRELPWTESFLMKWMRQNSLNVSLFFLLNFCYHLSCLQASWFVYFIGEWPLDTADYYYYNYYAGRCQPPNVIEQLHKRRESLWSISTVDPQDCIKYYCCYSYEFCVTYILYVIHTFSIFQFSYSRF